MRDARPHQNVLYAVGYIALGYRAQIDGHSRLRKHDPVFAVEKDFSVVDERRRRRAFFICGNISAATADIPQRDHGAYRRIEGAAGELRVFYGFSDDVYGLGVEFCVFFSRVSCERVYPVSGYVCAEQIFQPRYLRESRFRRAMCLGFGHAVDLYCHDGIQHYSGVLVDSGALPAAAQDSEQQKSDDGGGRSPPLEGISVKFHSSILFRNMTDRLMRRLHTSTGYSMKSRYLPVHGRGVGFGRMLVHFQHFDP